MSLPSSLELASIRLYYQKGGSPFDFFDHLYRRISLDQQENGNVWISLRKQADINSIQKEILIKIEHIEKQLQVSQYCFCMKVSNILNV